MAEHHPRIPAAQRFVFPARRGWWATFQTDLREVCLALEVVAWDYDGVSATPIVIHPQAEDGEMTDPLLSAEAGAREHDWRFIGVERPPRPKYTGPHAL